MQRGYSFLDWVSSLSTCRPPYPGIKLALIALLQGSKVPLRRDSARLSRADSLSDKEDMDVDEAVLQASSAECSMA